MAIYQYIEGLIKQGIQSSLIEAIDVNYVRNQLLSHLKLDSFPETIETATNEYESIPDLLEKITAFAIETGVIEDVLDDRYKLSAAIMNCFTARPSVINQTFYQKYELSPVLATDYFYQLSKNNNYIQMKRIKKNIHYKAETIYGKLDITINLSKPEKDPKQIKRETEMKRDLHYPKCLLCIENEGYAGRPGHPPRANHRMIKVPLLGENWYLQYSPYVYYNEHSILLSEEHRNMKISRKTFERLIAFIEMFPHYFIGSNADLPIVGGSILSHDHYQAGRYEFAMTRAESVFTFSIDQYKEVEACVLKWPLSVIRLKSRNKEQLLDVADHILQTWRSYSDEKAQISAYTADTPHNTITPIARMHGDLYELDLVLRNNRTTEECPLGIFHPHADVHHIKKENIGLIEVMGLAVLPARLKEELENVKRFLIGDIDQVADYHSEWANQLKAQYGLQNKIDDAGEIVKIELGSKFAKVLEDAGVFKQTNEGLEAFRRFTNTL